MVLAMYMDICDQVPYGTACTFNHVEMCIKKAINLRNSNAEQKTKT